MFQKLAWISHTYNYGHFLKNFFGIYNHNQTIFFKSFMNKPLMVSQRFHTNKYSVFSKIFKYSYKKRLKVLAFYTEMKN
jgi:hypothetical protein